MLDALHAKHRRRDRPLSASRRRGCDRSQKFALYRRLASLQEYVLVDPDTRRVEAFRLSAESDWVLHDMSDGDTLHVGSLNLSVPLAEVFGGI